MSLIKYGLQTGAEYLSIGLTSALQSCENTTWLFVPMDLFKMPNTIFAVFTIASTFLPLDKSEEMNQGVARKAVLQRQNKPISMFNNAHVLS